MPVTVAASQILGRSSNVVKATAQVLSTAGVSSVDTLTINHGLGITPDTITIQPRSVISTASGGTPQLQIQSYDATRVVAALPALDGAAVRASFDVTIAATHTRVR